MGAKFEFKFLILYVCVFIKPLSTSTSFSLFSACPSYLPPLFPLLPSMMTTSPDSQISPQTPKQDGVEVVKSSLGNPKQLRGAIPSVPQALPATPAPDHYGDDAAESKSAEDADTETETESEVQIQGEVQLQDQDHRPQ